MLNPFSLLLAQFVAHLSFVLLIFYGELWHWAVAILVYFFNGCLGMTMTYHRYFAHRSWHAPRWFQYLGVFFATIGMTGSVVTWASIHRAHHKFADTQKDPHSPKFRGFIFCQWFSMFAPVEFKYITDLLRDPLLRWQHKYYFFIVATYASLLYASDPFAVVYAFLAPACILWNSGSLIVTIGHMWGENTHNLQARSKNNRFLAALVWGEGWHNNHHFAPQAAVFSTYLDLGGTLIKILDPSATDVHQPPKN